MTLLSEQNMFRFLVVVFVLGTIYRLYPVLVGQPVLAQFFITEDGYLMLTVARNIALGLGMSVSDGTIPSNGVQPLATFLYAIPFWLGGGDKEIGLIGVQLIATLISIAGIFAVRALALLLLRPIDDNPVLPWMVAGLWYVGPLLLSHTMNGLETGLYAVVISVTLVSFGRLLDKGDKASFGDRLIIGIICGVAFLVRNDAVFLITSMFAVWVASEIFVRRVGVIRAAINLLSPGLASLIVAAPWLINNYVNFGSIVPVSGTAQALSGGFAKNAALLPAILFENAFPMLPVPAGIETIPLVQAVLGVIVLAVMGGGWLLMSRHRQARALATIYLLFAAMMIAYYGFYFGAGWFLSRYLSPLAPFLITAALTVLVWVIRRWMSGSPVLVINAFGVVAILLSVLLLGRYLIPGQHNQGHFQVVEWIQENVAPDTWVGAVQTGTVGFWHDRTINLDGKVNQAALTAIQTEGHVLNYVLESKIDILADWYGIVHWTNTGNWGNTTFSESFELHVEDEALNLGVLVRK